MVNLGLKEIQARQKLGEKQIVESSKLLKQKQSFENQLASRRLKTQNKSYSQNITSLKKFTPAPFLSQEQSMLRDMFAGEQTFGTGTCLPKLTGSLNPNRLGYDEDETAQSFGFGKVKSETGGFFGF